MRHARETSCRLKAFLERAYASLDARSDPPPWVKARPVAPALGAGLSILWANHLWPGRRGLLRPY
jgi:hypothetical protein